MVVSFLLFPCLGANVLAVERNSKRNALHFAASQGNTSCVSLLLQKGADSLLEDADGVTPLVAVCRSGSLDCLQQLLLHNGQFRGPSAIRALLESVIYNRRDCVQYLVRVCHPCVVCPGSLPAGS